jgi:vacuolar-type H+-ATPase subunit F/Vma7
MNGFVIGDNDMLTGFRLVGVEGKEATSAAEALNALKEVLARKDYAIIIISQELANQSEVQLEINKTRKERTAPLIVEFPSSSGKANPVSLSELVSKSLGVRM